MDQVIDEACFLLAQKTETLPEVGRTNLLLLLQVLLNGLRTARRLAVPAGDRFDVALADVLDEGFGNVHQDDMGELATVDILIVVEHEGEDVAFRRVKALQTGERSHAEEGEEVKVPGADTDYEDLQWLRAAQNELFYQAGKVLKGEPAAREYDPNDVGLFLVAKWFVLREASADSNEVREPRTLRWLDTTERGLKT